MKIPIIFILGVTTTFDALRKFLPSSVMHNLQLCKFTLEPPGRRMDSLIEYVLVRSCSGFFIGHKIALCLRNHFLRHDGTITSFLKALKLACVKHFSGEPLSFLCLGMLHEDSEAFWSGSCESLSEVLRSYAFDLPSCQRGKANWVAQGLSKLKWLQNSWSSVILMNKEVKKLRSMINLPSDGHTSKEKHTANIHWYLESSIRGKGAPFLNDEAAMLLVSMLRKFLVPIESVPFHEIFCFKDVASLKSALIGDQRRVIQDDLLKSDRYLQSTSCSKREFFLSSSTHDSAIMYSLAQEYGDLINLHDWYHSFKTKVMFPCPKAKRRVQHSPTSKKRKSTSQDDEVSIQARFCKAVTELQITGLVRMPSKRRPDFLQRIAFDL